MKVKKVEKLLDNYTSLEVVWDDNNDITELHLVINGLPYLLSGEDAERLLDDLVENVSVVTL